MEIEPADLPDLGRDQDIGRITRARRAGDPPDILIAPKVGPIGWFDFHRAGDAIELGEQAAEKSLTEIAETVAALSTPPALVTAVPK